MGAELWHGGGIVSSKSVQGLSSHEGHSLAIPTLVIGFTTAVINFIDGPIELTDVFRTKRRCSVPKTCKLVQAFWRVNSQT